MPIDDPSKSIPSDVLDRIMVNAVGSKKEFKKLVADNLTVHLIKELDLDHIRTMNQMILDKEISTSEEYSTLDLAIPNPITPIREQVLPGYVMDEARIVFAFSTFLSKIEVVKTLSKVRTECDRLGNSVIFATTITKTVKLDEFEQIQAQALANMKIQLKDR